MRNRIPHLLPLLLIASCATTHEPGWSGSGATPFNAARDSCQAQAQDAGDHSAQERAFVDCMRSLGWSRDS